MVSKKANYGLDAPIVVQNLVFFSFVALGGCGLSFLIQNPFWFWVSFIYASIASLCLLISAVWMIYSSKIAKPRIISKLIEELQLKKTDKVLDLGCGKGLFLIEAAKKLKNGNAYGVDIWLKKNQSGNKAIATYKNAKNEGVEVDLQTADLRSLPFPDSTFDAVVSSLAIHNIKDECGRGKALFEMLRVLKPGGKFFLLDIQYVKKYAEFLKDLDITCSKANYVYCPPIQILKGKKPKHTEISPVNKFDCS